MPFLFCVCDVISLYFHLISEAAGTIEIGVVKATDKDSGENSNISYQFLQSKDGYYIDAVSGVLFVNYSSLPNNHRDMQLAVVATDHGKPSKSAITSVRVSSGASSEIKPFIGQDTYR